MQNVPRMEIINGGITPIHAKCSGVEPFCGTRQFGSAIANAVKTSKKLRIILAIKRFGAVIFLLHPSQFEPEQPFVLNPLAGFPTQQRTAPVHPSGRLNGSMRKLVWPLDGRAGRKPQHPLAILFVP